MELANAIIGVASHIDKILKKILISPSHKLEFTHQATTMGILLVPYNNAMRLGQGHVYLSWNQKCAVSLTESICRFNSCTQQICIDDAVVVVDPERAENEITNDGTTVRILIEKRAQPSAWNLQPVVVRDKRGAAVLNRLKIQDAGEEAVHVPAQAEPAPEKSIGEESQACSSSVSISDKRAGYSDADAEDGDDTENNATGDAANTPRTEDDTNEGPKNDSGEGGLPPTLLIPNVTNRW